MLDVLAVGAVDGGEVEIGAARGDQPGAEIALTRKPRFELLDRLPRQDRHAVPRLLPVGDRVISLGLELEPRKLVVLELELLQPDEIGLTGAQPVEQKVEAGAETVDVPGGKAHGEILARTGQSRCTWPRRPLRKIRYPPSTSRAFISSAIPHASSRVISRSR